MNLEEMKKLHKSEPNNWNIYFSSTGCPWQKTKSFNAIDIFNDDEIFQIIRKDHEVIADAVIANPNVEIQYRWHDENWMGAKGSFFEYYDIHCSYQLKPQKQSFNGGYIKASQEAYDLLYALYGAKKCKGIRVKDIGIHYCFIVNENSLWKINRKEDVENSNYKQFYINNGALSWDKPKDWTDEVFEDYESQGVDNGTIDDFDIAPGIEKLANAISDSPLFIFATKVHEITNALAEMLIAKNAKYGNSALEPKRIFSKASAVEQILVRIDDKLSRMSNQDDLEDEDVVEDLLGYLVLLKIAKGKNDV